MNILPS